MKGFGWAKTLGIFGAAGVALYVATHIGIPWLGRTFGMEPVVCWFVAGGLGVFTPLIIASYILLMQEPARKREDRFWARRLRFRRMNRGDWMWGLGALMVIACLTGGIQLLLSVALPGGVKIQPSFMEVEPLTEGRYWIISAWVRFWFLNIIGEELLWRGVLLPRQELVFGRHAWIANAAGWLLFHVAFGWHMMLLLLPIIVILPFVTQRRKNSWVAVLIHAGLNGPAFLAVVFGLV